MQNPLESVVCQNCERKLRPPFLACRNDHLVCSNCNKHQDAQSGIIRDACRKRIFEISLLNKMFTHTLDFCQYNCGFRCNLLDLGNHERSCLERDKIIKCPIINCEWTNSIKRLIPHFDELHPNQLKTLANADEDLTITIQNPTLLVTQFEKNYPNNELYWVKLLEDNGDRYVTIIHQGKIGWRDEPDRKLSKYLISSMRNVNHFVKSDIVCTESDVNDEIIVKNSATLITALGGDEFVIKMKTPSVPAIPENILTLLECPVCMETMRGPIYCCEIGHSYCRTCTFQLESCPTCRGSMHGARNFALEQLSESLDYNCPYNVVGCGAVGTKNEIQKHAKKCNFRASKCNFFSCEWLGTYHGIYNHWEEQHPEWIKRNGSTFTDTLGNRYLYNVSGNNFIFKGVCDLDNFCLSLHHLTPEDNTDFYFDLELKNARTGQVIGYSCKCLPSSINSVSNSSFVDTSADVFITPIKWFKNVIVNEDNGFTRTVTIYRK